MDSIKEEGIMSGHSKWHNIQKKKGVEDSKRSKVFSQLSKNIRQAVRSTGVGNLDDNPALHLAVEKAREANMPHENIQRAIDRGMGKTKEGGSLDEIVYEGYGPGGFGVLVVVRTDNKQRTGAEIRFMFDRAGGSLGSPGSAMYLFAKDGAGYAVVIPFPIEDIAVQEKAKELLDELEDHDDVEDVYTNAILEGRV